MRRSGGFDRPPRPFTPLAVESFCGSETGTSLVARVTGSRITGPEQTVSAPAGLGNPGWNVRNGAYGTSYVYRSDGPSLRRVVMREGKLLRVQSDETGFSLAAPLGGVAIRIITGSIRNCAVFDASTVQRDQPGRFIAGDASAAGLSDCSDASLLAPLGLDCENKGDAPTCGGPCPNGGFCVAGPGDTCTCHEACGGNWETNPSCDGMCPPGEGCDLVEPYLTEAFCTCIDPTVPCGLGQPGGYCPPDSTCGPTPGGGFSCIPTFCSGPYPTCGGTCDAGRNCVPVDADGNGFCICATPEFACDGASCGGFSCPAGEVCTVDTDPSGFACTCEPL
jgi:hypothetical protein